MNIIETSGSDNEEKKLKKLRVVLIVPNFRWCAWDVNSLWHFIPYNLCLLASMIGNMCKIKILGPSLLDLNEDGFKFALKNLKPDFVGITVLTD